jgi:diguanylate cyclase (GGDEF)-like protein
MQRSPSIQVAESETQRLIAALDLVDLGLVLLDSKMRVLLMNRRFREIWGVPPALMRTGVPFREIIDCIEQARWNSLGSKDRKAYLRQRQVAIRAGSIPPTQIEMPDGRQLRFRCDATPDGCRILTYLDITDDLRRGANAALEKISAELRFNHETLEDQANHLVMLAEAAEESAQRAEQARLMLEREIEERQLLETQLRRMATTDGLTGALNRSAFLASGQQAVDQALRRHQTLCVLMLDADHFKSVNDRYGHAGGDITLQHLVKACRAITRDCDLVGRLGGEEFAIALPAVSFEMAQRIAERVRDHVAVSKLPFGDTTISVTVSIGLTELRDTDTTIAQLIARADAALYQAKAAGRNRVVLDEAA